MEVSVYVISIGNEIMLGHITNTNAQYISKALSGIGIRTTRHISIPDEAKTIISSIKRALLETDILILTGGLGPTVDDLTLGCISKALDKKLIFQKRIADHIKMHFKTRKLKMPANNLRQAFIPKDARPILNNVGTAPGLLIPVRKKIVIALPGVPNELYLMFEKTVAPYLRKTARPKKIIKSRVIKITGLPESRVNEKVRDLLKIKGDVQMGIYPHPGEVSIKITAIKRGKKSIDPLINKIEKKIRLRLGNYIFGYDNEKLEEVVGKTLTKMRKTLSIAESCTGGLVANRITDVPGSSGYFQMGVVVYSNLSKNKILNIPLETIKKYGAVSKLVTSLMAKNIRLLAKTNIGIGISGIAGPLGATKKKGVGLVYIALSTKKKTICKEFRFLGQRSIVKYKATQAALDMIRLKFLSKTRS
ncbi:competence/damage-inducible protein A [Candidatus Omnitrophota bacterium]